MAFYTRNNSTTTTTTAWAASLPSYTPSPASPSPVGRRPRAYAFRVAPQQSALPQPKKGGFKFDPFADEPVQRTPTSPPSWETLQALASLSAPPPAPRMAHASLPPSMYGPSPQRKPYNHQLAQQARRAAPAKKLPGGVQPLYAPSPRAVGAAYPSKGNNVAKSLNAYSTGRVPQTKALAYEFVEYDDDGDDYDVPPPPSPSPPPPYTPTSHSLDPRSPIFTPRYPAPSYAPRSVAPPPSSPQRLARTPSPPATSPVPNRALASSVKADKDVKGRLVAGILLNRVHVPKVRRRAIIPGEKRPYVGSALKFEVVPDA